MTKPTAFAIRRIGAGCTTLMASLLLLCSGCGADAHGKKDIQPPIKSGESLDPSSLYAKAWPGKPSLVKLTDGLVLSIPPQYHQFWTQRDWRTGRDTSNRPPMAIDKLPYAESAGFTMHLPEFEGYTPRNFQKDFDQDRVEVLFVSRAPVSSMEPGAPGSHAPNSLKRLIDHRLIPDPQQYEERYGLRCFDAAAQDGSRFCYGQRDAALGEDLILEVIVPPYGPHTLFPQMSTKYFTRKYGGLEVAWRTHMKNWSRWKQIDGEIWRHIDEWNVAPRAASPASSP